ncbi:MAG: BPSS1780 family membrane protein [Nitrosomonadaceae bacterium]|nr:BPSS1780 family membrane protein [Nitrosomonadaceae bacterium]
MIVLLEKRKMEARQTSAKQGWQWIVNGLYLFFKAPLAWVLLCFVLLLIAATLALIPMVGQFFFTLLSPLFLAGLMIGCRALERGEKLEIAYLFAGFRKNPVPLITVGGIYLVGQVLILGVAIMLGGGTLMELLINGKRVDENELRGVMSGGLTALMVALGLSIPLMMAAWFAPLLVAFKDMPAVAAMKLSFLACIKNIIPLQLYTITMVVLAVIAAMPYGLGFFLLVPVLFASLYASYEDIFVETVEPTSSV